MAKPEFAPGIPASRKIQPLPTITSPVTWEFVLQRHRALRAGEHLDMRLGNPSTGHAHSWAMKAWPAAGSGTMAIEQPTHTRQYMDFSGRIGPGYGEGDVTIERREKAEVLKSEADKLKFNLYRGREVEELVLRRTSGRDWVLQNITRHRAAGPGSRLPANKPKYRETSIDKIDHRRQDTILQAKLDGAHVIIDFWKEGQPPRVFSYRVSKTSPTGLINHTPKIKSMLGQTTPKGLQGTILRGEVVGIGPDGRAVPSARTGGMLNANTWTSREMQAQEGDLAVFAFDVISWRGKDVSSQPFSAKSDMLLEAARLAPWLRLPRTASTPAEKKSLLSDIKKNREPTTNEGVIEWQHEKHIPTKAKITREIDVWVREIFKEKGTRGPFAGGFKYSLTKNGPIIGKVGTGMSHELRADMLENPRKYIGLMAKIRVSPESKPGYAPRNPSFVGWHLDQEMKEGIKMASQFNIYMKKNALELSVAVPAAVAAGMGAVSAYDAIRSIGYSRDSRIVGDAIRGIGYETVDSRSYIKKADPTIVPVTSVKDTAEMIKDELIPLIEKRLGRKLDVQESEIMRAAEDMFSMTKNNAAALPGIKKGYVITAPKAVQAILDHEIGHLWDYRKKGLNIARQGEYEHVFNELFWKPTYKMRTYLPETNAWDLAPDSKYKKELEHHALGTYDKGFHIGRRKVTVPIGALAATLALGAHVYHKVMNSPKTRVKAPDFSSKK